MHIDAWPISTPGLVRRNRLCQRQMGRCDRLLGFVLPVAAVNVRSAVSSVPGGTWLVAAADDAYSAITPPLISAVEANYAAERILAAQRGWVVAYLKMYSPDPAGHVGQNG